MGKENWLHQRSVHFVTNITHKKRSFAC